MPAEYWSHPVKENDGAGVVSWGFPHEVKVRVIDNGSGTRVNLTTPRF